MQRGDLIPVREESAATTTNQRPADLPAWLDTLQPGDPIPVREEPAPAVPDQRPADRPAWVDNLQPGDSIPTRAVPITTTADQRPADLPEGVDTLQPGDPSPARVASVITTEQRPADLPAWLDTLQPGDPSPARVASVITTEQRPADLPEGVDTLQPGDPSPARVAPVITTEQRPADLPEGVDTLQPGDPIPVRTVVVTETADQRPADLPQGVDTLQRDDPISEEVTVSAATAPPPRNLRVTDSDEGSVDLSWDEVADAASYRVEYRQSGSATWKTGGYAYFQTTYTVDGLSCGTTYEFQVRARGDGDPYSWSYGDPSNTVSKKLLCILDPPSSVWVSSTGNDTSLKVSWSSVTGADAYKVEYRESGSTTWRLGGYAWTGTTKTVTGLTCGKTYAFRVSTRGNGTDYSLTYGDPSSTVSKKLLCILDPPGSVWVNSTDTDTSLKVSWSSVTGADAYKVEYRESGSSSWTTAGYVYSGTTRTVPGLTCGKTYEFRVSTRGNGTDYSLTYGDPSDEESRKLLCILDPPSSVWVSSTDNDTSLKVSWSSVTGADAYKVEYRESGSTTWRLGGYAWSGTTKTVTGLTCNKTYEFRVSTRGNGTDYSTTYGDPSGGESEKLLCIVDSPSSVSVTSTDNDTSLKVSWSSVTGAAAYWVEYRESGSSSWTTAGYVYSGTTRTVPGLTCGKTYEFRVSARGNGTDYSLTYSHPSGGVSKKLLCILDPPDFVWVSSTDNDTSLKVSWSSVTGAVSYRVEYRESGSSMWLVHAYVYYATTTTVDDLDCNNTYEFRVSSSGNGTDYSYTYGDPSDEMSKKLLCILDPPSSVWVSSTDNDTSLKVSWSLVAGAAAYRVEYRESGSAMWKLSDYVYSGTTRTQTELDCGKTYDFRVSARGNGVDYSTTYSEPLGESKKLLCIVDIPENLRVAEADNVSVSLIWDAVPNASAYKVEYRADLGDWTHYSYVYTGPSETVDGLVCDTDYEFQVRARGNGVDYSLTYSDPSDSISGDCRAPPPDPQVSGTDKDSVSLSWDAVTDASAYKVEYKASDAADWLHASYEYDTNAEIDDLDCDKDYLFRVRSRGDGDPYSWTYGRPSSPLQATCGDIVISISSSQTEVVEGASVTFTLTASPQPPAKLDVKVAVSEDGDFLTGTQPTSVTIGSNSTSASFTVSTLNDSTFEAHGSVTGTVLTGTGYVVGSDSSESVGVKDNDAAPAPTGIGARATGKSSIEASWLSRSGVHRYWLQRRTGSGSWLTVSNTIEDFSDALHNATYEATGLICPTSYKFRVRARGNGTTHTDTWGPWSLETDSEPTDSCTSHAFAPSPLALGGSSDTWVVPSGVTAVYVDVDFSRLLYKDNPTNNIKIQLEDAHGIKKDPYEVDSEDDSGLIPGIESGWRVSVDVDKDAWDRHGALVSLAFYSGSARSGPAIARATVQKEAQPSQPLPATPPIGVDADTGSMTLKWSSGPEVEYANPHHYEVRIPTASPEYLQDDIRTSTQHTIADGWDAGLTGAHDAWVSHCNAAHGCSHPLIVPLPFHFTPHPLMRYDTSNVWTVPSQVTGVYLGVDFSTGTSLDSDSGDIRIQRLHATNDDIVLNTHLVDVESDAGTLTNVTGGSRIRIVVDSDVHDSSRALVKLNFHSGSSVDGPVMGLAEVQTEAKGEGDRPGSITLSSTRPVVGTMVAATLSDPDGGVTGISWQWQRSSTETSGYVDISGATGSSYTVMTADQGDWLRATVTYTDSHGPNKSVVSSGAKIDELGEVSLSNTSPIVGTIMFATLTDRDGGVTGKSWQWERSSDGATGWTAISGAAFNFYTAADADKGKWLRATVSYTDSHGSGKSASSDAVAVDQPGTVSLSTASPSVGTAISATLSDADGSVTGKLWQWERSSNGITGWTAITGGTLSSYTVANSDQGLWLRATVSYSDGLEPNKTASSSSVSVPLLPPTGLTSTTGDGTIMLTWDPVPNAAEYEIQQRYEYSSPPEWRDLPFPPYTIDGSRTRKTITDTTAKVGGLTNGVGYSHRVRSKNSSGESAWSNVKSTSIPLAAPTGLDVVPLPQRSVRLKWNSSLNNPTDTGFRVDIRVAGGTWSSTNARNVSPPSDVSDPWPSIDIDLDVILSDGGKGLADSPAYELRVSAERNTSISSGYSNTITLVDSPIVTINGDSSLTDGVQGPIAGKAVVRWKPQSTATSYTLRWRKLGVDANGLAHSSDGWQLDEESLPESFGGQAKGLSSSLKTHTIQPLDLRAVYAVQLNYQTASGSVFSARDAYVWPAASKPGLGIPPDSDERVAGYPFFGHFESKVYEYRVCADTFYPDDPVKQEKWVALIVDALEEWEKATDGFIEMTPEYKDSSKWKDPAKPEFEGCTTYPSWWQQILVPKRVVDDATRSEIRMLKLPGDITELSNLGEMLLDPFKVCVFGASACSTSLVGYGQLVRDASTVLPSADITFNQNKLDAANKGAGVKHEKPDSVSFNTCMEGSTPRPNDSSKDDKYYAYALTVHEAGHALGLSDWTLGGTAARGAISVFNTIVDAIDWLDKLPFVDLPDIPKIPDSAEDLTEDAIYRASHPKTPDSVMNYDGRAGVSGGEPDCSPYPLDVMAIYSLYQTELP